MKTFITVFLLCFFFSTVFAQSPAADKDAIDLTAKMDTIVAGNRFFDLGTMLNVGLKNSDQWEDFTIFYAEDKLLLDKLRFGGPLLFDSVNIPPVQDYAILYGDFDNDGIGDLIGVEWRAFYKGKKEYPYFDSVHTTQFATQDKFANFLLQRAFDFDEDGITDYLATNDDNSARFYKGSKSFGEGKYLFATDSIQFPSAISSMIVGKFNPRKKPYLICYVGNKTYLIKQTANSFAEDSVMILSDSASGGILVKNLYATDITGDGITDLIVSDGYHIYIFKGGDDFGTYQLTPENAFYTIKSPRLTDYANYGFLKDFGTYNMRACGDLTGSGIPYLEIDADIDEAGYFKSYAFFYAGGKALDSLYDAVIGIVTNGVNFTFDTLHSINATGRTVCLINNGADEDFHLHDLNFLMSRDCEKIPHKTNPQMKTGIYGMKSEGMKAEAGAGFVRFKISSNLGNCSLTIYDLLGREISSRSLTVYGNDIEQFDTSEFADGTYFGVLQGNGIECSTKFLVSHAMKELAPESPVILQMNESIPSMGGLR
jgi:hypothetical protein